MRRVAALLFCLGLVFLHIAHAAWTTGSPPPISLFGAREIVLIVEAKVVSGRQNGSMRHFPQVTVLRASGLAELGGLTGSFYDYRQSSAQTAIASYAPGDAVTARIIKGSLFADRIDWFLFGAAVWMTLFASAILSAGGMLVVAGNFNQQRGKCYPQSPDNPPP